MSERCFVLTLCCFWREQKFFFFLLLHDAVFSPLAGATWTGIGFWLLYKMVLFYDWLLFFVFFPSFEIDRERTWSVRFSTPCSTARLAPFPPRPALP